jgi:4-hydroxybenzoate polyprenyltransferase
MSLIETFKVNKWWNYKIGGALFTYLLVKATYSDWNANVEDIVLLITFLLLIFLGFGINDYSDFEIDKLAKKVNFFNTVPLKFAPVYFITLSFSSITLFLYFLDPKVSLLLLTLVAINYLYSCKPFRLKEHKYLSVIATGIYERSLPYSIIILQVMSLKKSSSLFHVVFISSYLIWSFFWEIRNYINGQMKDSAIDEKSGIKLLLAERGAAKIESIKAYILYVEIALLLLWLSLAVVINHSLGVMVIFIILIPVIHRILQNEFIDIFSSKEHLLDYTYSYGFIAAIIMHQMTYGSEWWLVGGVFLLLLFSSHHFKNSVKGFYARVVLKIAERTYRYVNHVCFRFYLTCSRILNYSIYYFRKYVLRWPEEKCRGMKNRLIFLHIPKTAGTTFHNILDKQFAPENVFTIQVIDDAHTNIDKFTSLPKSKRKKIHLLKGHMNFGLHEYMIGETKYITLLRDPRERIISFYYYVLQNPNLELFTLIKSNNWSLHDFVANVDMKELNNAQLKLISGIEDNEEVMMEKAIENINNHFSFVGITEYFDESLKRLQKIYGWDISEYISHKVNDSRPKLDDIDPKTIKLIDEKNHGDILFYEKIKTEFLNANKS